MDQTVEEQSAETYQLMETEFKATSLHTICDSEAPTLETSSPNATVKITLYYVNYYISVIRSYWLRH